MRTRLALVFLCAAAAAVCAGCAALGQLRALVQAPRFEEAPDRPAEIRLLPPGIGAPAGGAAVRLWARVTNPNPFGFTLTSLRGTLYLEGSRAAAADFPLGLPLAAGQQTVVPLDLTLSFADLPGLAGALQRALERQPIAYRLDGTIGVEAGQFGTPTFGPMTVLQGHLRR